MKIVTLIQRIYADGNCFPYENNLKEGYSQCKGCSQLPFVVMQAEKKT